jgi:hypothetical protein
MGAGGSRVCTGAEEEEFIKRLETAERLAEERADKLFALEASQEALQKQFDETAANLEGLTSQHGM